ncbi:MAG: DUF4838 domain-containing protein [Lentisphaeria bacterium]|nr:DUF4838 domain-containing protein [Lentisphaeria bacterium]
MRTFFLCVLTFFAVCGILRAGEFVLSDGYVIVIPEKASSSEKFASRQLRKYLALVTGRELPVKTAGSPAVFVREDKELPAEKWKIFADAKGGLHITGGSPTGVLYAVYEFLEKQAGVCFLAPDAEFVPRKEKITFSSDLHLEGGPFFKRREVYLISGVMRRHGEYLGKMRFSGTWIDGKHVDPNRFGSTGNTHSFHILAKDLPKDKTEYYSLDSSGKRVRFSSGLGPGQFCLTDPEVRRLVAERLCRMIEDDRKKWNIPPRLYSLCKNDNTDDCRCPGCLAAVKKYGGNHAGLHLEFVSDIARKVGSKYPDVLIRTSAYTTDELPVEGFRLPDNVLLGVAQLGSEFRTAAKRDSMRRLDHPNNRKAYELLKKWRKVCKHMMSWDYWVLYRQQYAAPVTDVSAIVFNLKKYAEMDIRYIFAESETAPKNMVSFMDLRHYLASKLLTDPRADAPALTARFMKLYYGPAAEEMMHLLNYLESRMAEETRPLGENPPNAWNYLDKKFFDDTEKMFSRAEKAASGNQIILRRIGQERIPFDSALLCLGDRKGVRFDKKQIIGRLKKNSENFIAKYADAKLAAKWKKELDELILYHAFRPPLPKQFDNKKIFDFYGPRLQVSNTVVRKVEDKDSVTGSALCLSDLGALKKEDPGFHKKKLVFSLYDRIGKKTLQRLTVKKIPQDEKYHWYRLGKSRLSARSLVILHWSWWLASDTPGTVFDPLEPDALYETWVSVKLTGKDYVKNADQPSAIRLDRIVFVESAQ